MLLRSGALLLSLWAVLFTVGCARGGGDGELIDEPGDERDASVDGPSWGGPDASLDDDDDGGGIPTCTPKTCESFDAECGYVADGCGEVVFCGDCDGEGESCGGSGIANRCGGPCEPLSCDDLGVGCGVHGDGCGGSLDCGSCEVGEYCGGGGPNACGEAPVPVECKTKEEACDEAGLECGWVGDGCGGVVDCGSCPVGTLCGGAGVHNVCGIAPVDGGSICVPRTEVEACAGKDCGEQADGCGGLIDCGSCPAGSVCGVGGPSLCGAPPCTKVPQAIACSGKSCGEVGDGCGGTWSCGTCAGGESCGGGGTPFQCGKPFECIPKTCAQLGFNCGQATDGCGNVIDCGPKDCGPGKVCGGDGPNRCGAGGVGSSDPCPGGTTSISGKVYMPNGTVPVQGALVYVPKSLADIPTFANSVTCERCDSQIPPTAIAHAVSGTDGSFTLKGVPAGNVPVVIQVGRFRRKIDVPVTACQNVALSAEQSRLPKRHNEASSYDHIPKIAVVTGLVDAMECVLRRMGIADDQFSKPAGGKRIHIVQADSYGGGRGPKLSPSDTSQPRGSSVYGNQSTLDGYDMVLLACQSMAITKNDADINRLVAYANKGGRIFATHYSYTWLNKLNPFRATATWSGNTTAFGSNVGTVDTSFARGQAFADWLRHVGANVSGNPAVTQIQIAEPRGSVSAVAASARRWITATLGGTNYVQHYTFNTPVGAADDQQCGRVVFSDFHVSGGDALSSKNFPEQCANRTELSAEEKALAFMILDLAACIQSDDDEPTCTPKSCDDLGLECGPAGDGCGNVIPSCGTCPGDLSCGGGGVPGKCGKQECSKQSCASLGLSCGPASDGCGGLLDCGACDPGEVCGGGGVPGQCGAPGCSPLSCDDQGIECGPAGDGCGGVIPSCGDCPPGLSCGGGGVPGQCGYSDASACEPLSCAEVGVECGPIGDGCGGLVECGDCSEKPGTTCGGGGFPGKCGSPCAPATCEELGIECGPAGDGCGGVLECGECEGGQTCGGGGIPGQCGGGQCTPKTCEDFGYECGPAADGCGALLDCGTCTPPTFCGGGGHGKCGGVR